MSAASCANTTSIALQGSHQDAQKCSTTREELLLLLLIPGDEEGAAFDTNSNLDPKFFTNPVMFWPTPCISHPLFFFLSSSLLLLLLPPPPPPQDSLCLLSLLLLPFPFFVVSPVNPPCCCSCCFGPCFGLVLNAQFTEVNS